MVFSSIILPPLITHLLVLKWPALNICKILYLHKVWDGYIWVYQCVVYGLFFISRDCSWDIISLSLHDNLCTPQSCLYSLSRLVKHWIPLEM